MALGAMRSKEAIQKKALIRTFGWQMDAVLYDYCKLSKSHLVQGDNNETMV